MQVPKLLLDGLSGRLTNEINIFMCKQKGLRDINFLGTRPDWRHSHGMFFVSLSRVHQVVNTGMSDPDLYITG